MADKYDDLKPDSNMVGLPGWGRGSPSPAALAPAALAPKWAGQFDTFDAWVATATARLVAGVGSVGQDVPAICVDAKGRRCNIGRDFHRARDENAFPVRYFWECQPVDPTPEREALLAVEYATNAALPVLAGTLEDMAAWVADDCVSRDDLANWMRERAETALKAIGRNTRHGATSA